MAATASSSSTATPPSRRKLYNVFPKSDDWQIGRVIIAYTIGGDEYIEAANNNAKPPWVRILADEGHVAKLLAYPDIESIREHGKGDENLVEEKWPFNVFPKCPQDYDQIVQTEIFLTALLGSPPEPAYMDGELQFWTVKMSKVQSGKVGRHPGVNEVDD